MPNTPQPALPFSRLNHPDPVTQRIVQDIYDKLNQVSSSVTTLAAEASAKYSPATQQVALSSNGSNPLIIDGLTGTASQGQYTNIPTVTALPTSGPLVQNGIMVRYNNLLYLYVNGWIQAGSVPVIEDTHANKLLKYPASNYPVGSVYFETDTGVFLLNEPKGQIGSQVQTWTPRWAYPIEDTRNNQILYPPIYYPEGMAYYQTDTLLTYITQPITFNVNVTGNRTVTSTGLFYAQMVGYPILLGGIWYQVASFTSNLIITLASDAPNGTAVSMTIPSDFWQYQSGVWSNTYANRPGLGGLTLEDVGLPYFVTDLNWVSVVSLVSTGHGSIPAWVYVAGTATGTLGQMTGLGLSKYEFNLRFFETDYGHVHRWDESMVWQFVDGDTSQYIVIADISPQGPVTTGASVNGWYPCDGGSYVCVNGDGSTRTVNTQNINGSGAVGAILSGGWNVNQVAGALPTFVGLASTSNDQQPAQTVQSGTGASVPAEPHTHIWGGPAGVPAPINIPSDTNGGLPASWRVSMWLRA